MQLSELTKDIRLYIRLEGEDLNSRIKSFINDACIQLPRKDEWAHLDQSATFTTDDSGSYEIADFIPEPYVGITHLLQDQQAPITKTTYLDYLQSSTRTSMWAVHGQYLYIEGTDEQYNVLYSSCGTPYPLIDDDHENSATFFYPDIIKYMAITNFLKYIGDLNEAKVAEDELTKLLIEARAAENRARKSGRSMRMSSHNR